MISEFHKAALMYMLDDPEDQSLRAQIPYLSVVDFEHTGVGCDYIYGLSESAPLQYDSELNYIICLGKSMYAKEFSDGASMILHVRKGKIAVLDILVHGDDYPETEPTEYRFEDTPYNIIDQRGIKE